MKKCLGNYPGYFNEVTIVVVKIVPAIDIRPVLKPPDLPKAPRFVAFLSKCTAASSFIAY